MTRASELRYRMWICLGALVALLTAQSRLLADEVLAARMAQQAVDIAMLAAKVDAVIEYLKWQAAIFTGLLLSSLGWLLNALYMRKGRS